jgi:hypothetical protein
MWSRRHFSNAHPVGIVFLQNLFTNSKTSAPVVNNLAAVALPLRRLARTKPLNPAH